MSDNQYLTTFIKYLHLAGPVVFFSVVSITLGVVEGTGRSVVISFKSSVVVKINKVIDTPQIKLNVLNS